MKWYVLNRIAQGLFTIWAVTAVLFCLTRIFGDPISLMLPLEATEQDRQNLTRLLNLDKPIPVQYLYYINDVAHGNFGFSYVFRQPAAEVILKRIPATMELACGAMIFSILIGITAGMLSVLRPRTWIERISMGLALFGQAAPFFWVGLVLIMLFSVYLGLLPSSGRGGLVNLILPSITLGMWSTAAIARLTRSRMKEVLSKEYIKLARLKGLRESVIIWKHAFRNATIPIVTLIGLELGSMLGGAVVTETVFAWPGIGRLVIESVLLRDYALVSGITIFVSFIFVGLNLVIDLTYGIIDPRVALSKRSV